RSRPWLISKYPPSALQAALPATIRCVVEVWTSNVQIVGSVSKVFQHFMDFGILLLVVAVGILFAPLCCSKLTPNPMRRKVRLPNAKFISVVAPAAVPFTSNHERSAHVHARS